MSDLLRGNFTPKDQPQAPVQPTEDSDALSQEFEEKALSFLGGSICFVMKRNEFVWNGDGS